VNQVRAPTSSRNTPRISGFTRSNPVWGRPPSEFGSEVVTEFPDGVDGDTDGFVVGAVEPVVPVCVAPGEDVDPPKGGKEIVAGGVNGGPVVIPVVVGVVEVTAVLVGWVVLTVVVVTTGAVVSVIVWSVVVGWVVVVSVWLVCVDVDVVGWDGVPPSWVVVCSVECVVSGCVGSGWTGGCGLASATPPMNRKGDAAMSKSLFIYILLTYLGGCP
jgi:hypothetical protein